MATLDISLLHILNDILAKNTCLNNRLSLQKQDAACVDISGCFALLYKVNKQIYSL